MLVLLARQWCSTPEDVVQEAFLKLSSVQPMPENPAAWLYTAVRNRAISAGRSQRRRSSHEQRHRSQQGDWFIHDATQKIDADTAVTALQQLSAEQREVIIAHLWGELTFEEIGQMQASSSSTAHRYYTQGLEHLRTLLGEIHVP